MVNNPRIPLPISFISPFDNNNDQSTDNERCSDRNRGKKISLDNLVE